MTQLGLRNFPRRVARDVKRAAAASGITLTEFMVMAATRALREPTESVSAVYQLDRDLAWYERHHQQLSRRYAAGTYLAVVGQEVVDEDRDPRALATRIRETFGRKSFVMPLVGASQRTMHLRSPRLPK